MDRISNLPDELLCHILSFLTTKEAALTSILSKRWRDLFGFVPYLLIDGSVLLHPEEGKSGREDIIQSFVDFVDRVFDLQGDSPIKKLSLKCLTKVGSECLDDWISNVLTRGVSELDLAIIVDPNRDNQCCLPRLCFECSTLVKLKLGFGIDIGRATDGRVFLPMLKSLYLDKVWVCNDEYKALLHELPALEELVLDDVIWEDDNVTVSSASLKTLTIKSQYSLDSLWLDTPSLVCFKDYGSFALEYLVVVMKNLLDARIILVSTDYELAKVRESDNVDYDDNVWKLFNGIRNVLHLELSADTLEILSLCCETMPVFNNLKSLAIKSDKDRRWEAMPVLLSNCPNLEALVLEGLVHQVTDMCGDACDCISWEGKGGSLKLCPVKVLKIRGFRGTMKEMSMIKHFLDYLPLLQEMEIYVAEDGLENPEAFRVISETFELYQDLKSCNVHLHK